MTSVIFFIGPQGSGKGTQAKLLAQKLNFFHWDMGGIVREARAQENDLANRIKDLYDKGIYLTDELIMEIARQKLESIPNTQGIIFDGLPRRLSQAEFLIKFLQDQGRQNLTTIFLDIPKDETLKRLVKRAELEHRVDDTPEAIERRLQQYYDETLPMMDFMRRHTNVMEIDGRPAIEEVTKDINQKLELN